MEAVVDSAFDDAIAAVVAAECESFSRSLQQDFDRLKQLMSEYAGAAFRWPARLLLLSQARSPRTVGGTVSSSLARALAGVDGLVFCDASGPGTLPSLLDSIAEEIRRQGIIFKTRDIIFNHRPSTAKSVVVHPQVEPITCRRDARFLPFLGHIYVSIANAHAKAVAQIGPVPPVVHIVIQADRSRFPEETWNILLRLLSEKFTLMNRQHVLVSENAANGVAVSVTLVLVSTRWDTGVTFPDRNRPVNFWLVYRGLRRLPLG